MEVKQRRLCALSVTRVIYLNSIDTATRVKYYSSSLAPRWRSGSLTNT